MYDVVVKGKLVLEDEVIDGEVGINSGKITIVSKEKNKLESKIIYDFKDNYVFPGMIDTHVHCYTNPVEGFRVTSEAAAVGGITTFFDMPFDNPKPIINVQRFEEKLERLKKEAVVNIGLWGTIKKEGGTEQIIPLAKAGAFAFKMSTFESDENRFPRIPDYEIIRAMKLIKKTNLRVAFHSENDELIKENISMFREQGKTYPRMHMESCNVPVCQDTKIDFLR